MKKKVMVLIAFILQYQYNFSQKNIYVDALSHFIDYVIEGEESALIKKCQDSLYNHVLIFEDTEKLRNISNPVNGYSLKRIKNMKEYLVTSNFNHLKIFVMSGLEFNQISDTPFFIRFDEIYIEKRNNTSKIIDITTHFICYKFTQKKNKNDLIYSYSMSGEIDHMEKRTYAYDRGWVN